MWRKKRVIIPLSILLFLIIVRLLLPYFVLKYVNKSINDIPGYIGHVEDIDIALYRGAYVIRGLSLDKENAESPEPLLKFPKTDISIEWSAIWKGKIVSEIVLHQPEINYIFEDQQKPHSEGKPEIDHWTETLSDLVPIDINHLQIYNGKLSFVQLSSNPNIDLMLDQVELQATNLQNVIQDDQTLPSTINATAVSFGGGATTLQGRINVMKEIPDMDIEFALENADVTALNDMSLSMAGIDFESGIFQLYSEIAISDAYMKGYIKPMFIDTKLLGEDDQGFLERIWEGFVGVFNFLFKNQGTDTLATRAPLEGDLNNPNTSVISTILNIFKNGWIQAFTTDVDEDIDYQDVLERN